MTHETHSARTRSRARAWKPVFIEALRALGNVRVAAHKAGISRGHAYLQKQKDPNFAEAWDDAVDDATDMLELEARRRAMEGTERTEYLRTGTDDKGNPTLEKVTYRQYSDKMLMFLLRGLRPEKYRENFDLEKLVQAAYAAMQTESPTMTRSSPNSPPRIHSSHIKFPRARRGKSG